MHEIQFHKLNYVVAKQKEKKPRLNLIVPWNILFIAITRFAIEILWDNRQFTNMHFGS